MTHDLFNYSASMNGRLLGYMGLIASILQGGVTRRLPPLVNVKMGVISCLISFFMLSRLTSVAQLYMAATLLAITTATVVTGLNSLSSFEAGENERGGKLGNLRSWGQIGRATGPLAFCTLYWWAGREVAYVVGGSGMLAVAGLVFAGLKTPKGTEESKVKDVKSGKANL
jgi:MFS family permease